MRVLGGTGLGTTGVEEEVPFGAVEVDDVQLLFVFVRKVLGILVDGLSDGVSPDGTQKFSLVVGKGELVGVDLGRLVAFGALLTRLMGVLVPVVKVVFLVPND